ncbi:MAG: hypothetical protein JNL95_00290 [Chitinophagales bacterium]|nr:hypothetical protein [Chitinophagales bacterium]
MKITLKLISVFAVVLLILNGCKKDGPVTLDSIPPTLTITISGGGYTKTFNQIDYYWSGSLNLKPNTKYNVTCALADSGGVKPLQLVLPKFLISQLITGVPNDTVLETPRDFTYKVSTDENIPYRSSLLTGSFVTPDAGNTSYYSAIGAVGSDFNYNRAQIIFNVSVENNPVGGFGWVTY